MAANDLTSLSVRHHDFQDFGSDGEVPQLRPQFLESLFKFKHLEHFLIELHLSMQMLDDVVVGRMTRS